MKSGDLIEISLNHSGINLGLVLYPLINKSKMLPRLIGPRWFIFVAGKIENYFEEDLRIISDE